MNVAFAKALDRGLGSLLGRVVGLCDRARASLRAPPAVRDVRHILVMKFWGLGNWALLRPIVRDLRARWPEARMTIATLDTNVDLVRDLADEILVVRGASWITVARDLLGGIARLRRRPVDLALDFEQFARVGALLARLGGARQRVGFRTTHPARDDLYTVLVPFGERAHVSRSWRDLAEAAGVSPAPYVPGALEADARGRREAAAFVPSGAYVVLHPGSGDNFPGRRWSAAGFEAAGRAAAARGVRVLVTGGASEAVLVERVAHGIGPAAVALAGRLSLPGFVAVLAGARVLVSNDTGPVHVASALGVPTLAIFGPNTPVLYGPLAEGSRAFYRALPCSPCLTTANYRSSRCRIHTCMAAIRTGGVAHALDRLLAAEGRPVEPAPIEDTP